MNTLFVPYRLALELKQLGFNEPCLAVFDDEKNYRLNSEPRNWNNNEALKLFNLANGDTTSAPTFYQAFKWFDENTILRGFVVPSNMKGYFDYIVLESDEPRNQNFLPYVERNEAELDCLEVLIVQQNYIESHKTK
jgi:hypothetical protein